AYAAIQAAGELLTLTARKDGVIVGYYVCHIAPGLHYASTLTAKMDMMWVRDDLRGRGIGIKLFKAMQDELRRRRVAIWYSGSKVDSVHDQSMHRLLRKLG